MKLLKLVPDNTNVDFMKWRNVALVLSILVTAASIALTAYRGLNLGIDFVGGQVIRATFAKPVSIEDLRDQVESLNVGEASIQEFGDNRTFQIRLPRPEGPEAAANQVVTAVRGMIVQQFPGAKVTAGESVSGKVSGELAWDGALAITFAMIGIAIYIWFRFEWQFGVGALITLFHDVAMVLGFFSVTQLQVDLNIVAAFLAIVGYSLNDTVVIYDRIRENLRRYKSLPLPELVDLSINQTLARTIMTSMTTLLALIALVVFGGPVIRDFTIAMIWGVVIGCYSTVYVASPMILHFHLRRETLAPAAEAPKG